MNDEELDALFNTARTAKRDTSRQEYGFETRLLAHIHEERRDRSSIFGWAWRLTPYFAGIVVAMGAWVYYVPPQIDLQAISANGPDDLQFVEYLTGDKI